MLLNEKTFSILDPSVQIAVVKFCLGELLTLHECVSYQYTLIDDLSDYGKVVFINSKQEKRLRGCKANLRKHTIRLSDQEINRRPTFQTNLGTE